MHLGAVCGGLPPQDIFERLQNPENHAKMANIWKGDGQALHTGCKCMSSSPTCRLAFQLMGLEWVVSAMVGKVAES
eukprot:365362-Chlamydomonas_euryale.AAC.29